MKESLPGEVSGRTALLMSGIMSFRLRRVTWNGSFIFLGDFPLSEELFLETPSWALKGRYHFFSYFLSADFAKMHWMPSIPWFRLFDTEFLKLSS